MSRVRTCYFGMESSVSRRCSHRRRAGARQDRRETEASLAFGIPRRAGRRQLHALESLARHRPVAPPRRENHRGPIQPRPAACRLPALTWDVAVIHALSRPRGQRGSAATSAWMSSWRSAGSMSSSPPGIVEGFDGRVHVPGAVVVRWCMRRAVHGRPHATTLPRRRRTARYIDACNSDRFGEYLQGLLAEGVSTPADG